MVSLGIATENKYMFNDPVKKMHADYLNKEALNLSVAKMPVDATVMYDKKALQENIPTLGDLDRSAERGARQIRHRGEADKRIRQIHRPAV
ncbi:hypothetical protein LJK88_17935 [Paenibacillus sp. P26]|nr:hypothetical protein LJK88_17935 [Paenibacillus sp. P26]